MYRRTLIVFLILLGLIAFAPPAAAQAVIINPAAGRFDMTFDDARGLLYLSTNNGNILRYNPVTNSFLAPWLVGVNIRGIDTTPDGNYLLAAEANVGVSQAFIRRIDLNTGAVTNLAYNHNGDSGGFHILALNDGQAIFNSTHSGSGNGVALRSVDLATFSISQMTVNGNGQSIYQVASIFRSRDRSTVLMVNTGTSQGDLSTYSTDTDNYLASAGLGTFANGLHANLSPNGDDYTISGFNIGFSANHSADLSLINPLPGTNAGFAYDPSGSLLYVARTDDNRIHKFRTSDYLDVGSFAAGFTINGNFNDKSMTVSGDGKWLFFASDSTLYTYAITPVPEPASLTLLAAGALLLLKRRSRTRSVSEESATAAK